MKLLLILPKNNRSYWGGVSKSGKAGFVRLNLPTIAALTPKNWDVEILDARVKPVDYDTKVDLVGITGFTAEMPSAYGIADNFRKKSVKVVMGGVHVSAVPDEALKHADAVVIGEAELVWEKLLADFQRGELKQKYKADHLCDMKNMAIPRRELLDRSMYSGFYTLQATRGCPFWETWGQPPGFRSLISSPPNKKRQTFWISGTVPLKKMPQQKRQSSQYP